MPPRFFITHSWSDIHFARRLFDDLTAQGLEGWLDDKTLQGGHRLAEQINRGLEWCDFYIPILSRTALESPWCWEEINAAINLSNRRQRNGRPRILPVLIEHIEDEMPALLAGRLYFNFVGNYEDALRELLVKGFGLAQEKSRPNLVLSGNLSLQKLSRTIVGKDGKEMMLVPAGEFVMGSNENKNEKPPHPVYLDAFYIDRYPVTNAEYKKFVEATKHNAPPHWQKGKIPNGKENHPVVSVTWEDAAAYAKWVGARLPTEAEWEKAASWDEAQKVKRVYPWGDQFDSTKCNSSESGVKDTTSVGKYSPQGDSFYGVGDMAGNVWEWCADWYDENFYENSPRENPRNDTPSQFRVLRGGSWLFKAFNARCAGRYRDYPGLRNDNYGFRCARSSPSSVP